MKSVGQVGGRNIRIGAVGIWIGIMAFASAGCAVKFSQRSPWDIQQIQALSEQLDQVRALAQLKADEAERLRQAKALLEQRLSSEIADQNVTVGFDDRGLVVRVLDQILFDSGKAKLRKEAYPVLEKVAKILNQELAGQSVGIEGHTDNVPITRSGWKDNWELSMARARAVLTYLVKERGVDPSRVSATGYGEYHPLTSNDTPEGRRKNRRVEITVLPSRLVKEHHASQTAANTSPHPDGRARYTK